MAIFQELSQRPSAMKLKTRKTISKRIHITKKKKILRRQAGQDHFNARESGKTTKRKRRDRLITPSFEKNIRREIPYH